MQSSGVACKFDQLNVCVPKSVKISIVNHALTNQDACNAYDVVKSMTPSMPVLMKYNRLKKFF